MDKIVMGDDLLVFQWVNWVPIKTNCFALQVFLIEFLWLSILQGEALIWKIVNVDSIQLLMKILTIASLGTTSQHIFGVGFINGQIFYPLPRSAYQICLQS